MKQSLIVVTGAAGFIGSNLARALLERRFLPASFERVRADHVVLVDDLASFQNRLCAESFKGDELLKISIKDLPEWLLGEGKNQVKTIFHMGACSSTEEFREDYLREVNTDYSKKLWQISCEQKINFIYASSAATYGDGSQGFSDDPALIPNLKPLNPYGVSKHRFDLFVLDQVTTPPVWAGLKFFNVYGPGEDHKGSQANVVFHATNQVLRDGVIELFKSHNSQFKDGEQKRDFVYVGDVVRVCMKFAFANREESLLSGIYNVGTGKARSFLDLARAVFKATKRQEKIEFIDTPEKLRAGYQYYTQAEMGRLIKAGYKDLFVSLEQGTEEYLRLESSWKGKI